MGDTFRDDLLVGKTAFITGGGSGICKGIAEGFMRHGAKVAISSRKQERLDAASAELSEATGGTCIGVAADVRQPDTIAAALDKTIEELGGVDIVINGAAGNFLAPAAQLSPNGFRTVMEIDACGTFNVSKLAFDKALRDNGGCIINISATLHYAATGLQIHASSAKAAVDTITRTLAIEWGQLGIRVNGIAPGAIDGTEGMDRLAPGGAKERFLGAIPLGRFGSPKDIADAALFLASPAGSYVSGETLVVDGAAWLNVGSMARIITG